jgi:spermidine synthase
MFFMGVGSYLSKYYQDRLIQRFVHIEYLIGLIGGFSAFLLYLSFSLSEFYYPTAFILIASISTLIGLEIPLVTRFLSSYNSLEGSLSTILSADYLGALLASILFPIVLLPYIGIMKSAFLIGILNIAVATYTARVFQQDLLSYRRTFYLGCGAIFILLVGLLQSNNFVGFFEKFVYQDEIIYSEQTAYQKIILTRFKNDTRLFLNGNLQFSSLDEHRYHEPLVHTVLSRIPNRETVLILGGGDGMALREVLKYPDLKRAVLVDLDTSMTQLAKTHPTFRELNKNSLLHPKAEVINQDAFSYIEQSSEMYSAVIIDLPDPNDLSLGKLYTKEFYELLKKRISPGGAMITQSSSPYLARKTFWCINKTLGEVFENVLPMHVYIPSFGPWGFNVAWQQGALQEVVNITVPNKFLNPEVMKAMLIFDADMSEVPVETNKLDNQVVVQYYESSL